MQKRESEKRFPFLMWSGRRVSNSRPQPWQGCALPTELLPHIPGGASRSRTDLHGFAIRCITALLSRRRVNHVKRKGENVRTAIAFPRNTGAGEESRTLDLNLGKVALYQLSYCRFERRAHYRCCKGIVNIRSFIWSIISLRCVRQYQATPCANNNPWTTKSGARRSRSASFPGLGNRHPRSGHDRATRVSRPFARTS